MAKVVLIAAIALTLLSGCDAIFTYSALSGLQRDPADMPLDQRVKYAEDALASGDEDAIADAYDAIKDDAAGSTDGDLQLLAGELALELSGINDAYDDLVNIDFGDVSGTEALVQNIVDGLDAGLVTDAAGFYQDAADNGGSLSGTDYLLGAMAMVAEAAIAAGDVATLTPASVTNVDTYLTDALASLPPDDPAVGLITDFQTWLASL
jgi:hypothetical protein